MLLKGDLDGDGQRTIADLGLLMTALADTASFKAQHSLSDADFLAMADANGDLAVNNLDLQGLIGLIAGAAGAAGGGSGSTAFASIASPAAIQPAVASASPTSIEPVVVHPPLSSLAAPRADASHKTSDDAALMAGLQPETPAARATVQLPAEVVVGNGAGLSSKVLDRAANKELSNSHYSSGLMSYLKSRRLLFDLRSKAKKPVAPTSPSILTVDAGDDL